MQTITDPDPAPPRGAERRKRDVLAMLAGETDAWVATASPSGEPTLVPLWFLWDRDTLLMSTRRTNPTARHVTPSGSMVVTLGHTRDVALIEGTAEVVESAVLEPESGDAFAARFGGWDPRTTAPWVFLRLTPRSVKAWRGVNEQRGRVLMRDGSWLV
ncbi:pyridoxamine 5'-phosphate oxidase family protein [Streptomyces sp. NPDC000594]|uniref:pyridoxamine 5'-phosphate oxidase family protein n=1 Tax=Streptomyces sp. NPDC000594 TaxID=3154261 RepID=UPI00331AACAD